MRQNELTNPTAFPAIPKISRRLQDALNPPGTKGQSWQLIENLPDTLREEGEKIVKAYEVATSKPADQPTLRGIFLALLETLNVSVANPVDEQTLRLRAGIVADLFDEWPAVFFGRDFTRRCIGKFKFLPTPAELLEIAEDERTKTKNQIALLRLRVPVLWKSPYGAISHREE